MDDYDRIQAGEAAATVRGKHYTEWLSALKELTGDDRITLLLECIDAVEAEQKIVGWEMADAYTEWAARYYLDTGDPGAAEDILLRYLSHDDQHQANELADGPGPRTRVEAFLADIRNPK